MKKKKPRKPEVGEEKEEKNTKIQKQYNFTGLLQKRARESAAAHNMRRTQCYYRRSGCLGGYGTVYYLCWCGVNGVLHVRNAVVYGDNDVNQRNAAVVCAENFN